MIKKPLLFFLNFYQLVFAKALSVWLLGGVNSCRFQPTCSQYSREAIENFGVLKGGFLSLKRICLCQPFGRFGPDPVPEK